MIISVLGVKGGTGKSTVAVNLAVGMNSSPGKRKRSILVIDTDNQGSALHWISERPNERPRINLISLPDAMALKKQAKDFAGQYDIVIIDGVPQVDKLATVSIAISDLIIIPVGPSPYDLWATETLVERIDQARDIKPNIKAYFLVNKFSERTILSRETVEALGKLNLPTLNSKLGNRVSYPDSSLQGLGVLEWSDSKAKQEMRNLVDEVTVLIDQSQEY